MRNARAVKASFEARVTVRIDVKDAEPVTSPYNNYQIVPSRFDMTYVQELTEHEHYTEYRWRCDAADAFGGRVLKPGPDGELRVSEKAVGHAHWFTLTGDLADGSAGDVPAVVRFMAEEARPVGDVDGMSFEL